MLLNNQQDAVARERLPWRQYSVHKRANGLTVKEVDQKNVLIRLVEEMGQAILALQLLDDPNYDDDLAMIGCSCLGIHYSGTRSISN